MLGPLAPLPGTPDDEERAVVRVPSGKALRCPPRSVELQRVRSARKLDPVRIQVDPIDI